MKRYALIGKNIGHSKSKDIYKKIISYPHEYYLLDYHSQELIPTLDQLMMDFDGLNITTPYKKLWINQENIKLTKEAALSDAINCIAKKNGELVATNTDFLALKKIIPEIITRNNISSVAVLGLGVMGKIVKIILEEMNFINSFFLTRSVEGDLSFYDLCTLPIKKDSVILVINCCDRDFCFQGRVLPNTIFFDLNYSLKKKHSVDCYIDGSILLLKQAELAVSFWEGR